VLVLSPVSLEENLESSGNETFWLSEARMNKHMTETLEAIDYGDPQQFRNLVVVPLTTPQKPSLEYLTFSESHTAGLISITEVDEGGSVPELKVVNRAKQPVLLLDGEELAGAKQNRVLNTTVLLKQESETVIPVSCTEQGRWNYVAPEFSDSHTVMSPSMRACKNRSVSASLESNAGFASDQGEVWDRIEHLHAAAGISSGTRAMRDAYRLREGDIGEAMSHFSCVDAQKGLLVLINGVVVGFDLLSSPAVYTRIHEKLTRSYVMDALVRQSSQSTMADKAATAAAGEFVARAAACKSKRYRSAGMGWDYRFHNGSCVGSSLLRGEEVIHCAFFTSDDTHGECPLATLRRRRSYRT
jgi:hypothetical protein